MTHFLMRLAPLLLLGACATPNLTIQVENATDQPVDWVDCRIASDDGGVGGGGGLAPYGRTTFTSDAAEATAVTVDVRWTEGSAVEHIELGPVTSPGAGIRLLGPGRHEPLP